MPKPVYDSYYLTVGAERIWTVLHGIPTEPGDEAASHAAWRQFVTVNRAIATAAANLAPKRARITVHDYTLLLVLPVIRRLRPDVSLAYVHHTPWPDRDRVTREGARTLVAHLARATQAADVVLVSADRWKRSLETWSTVTPICLARPGIDRSDLHQRARAGATGHWAELLRGGDFRPVVAAVGRTDPSKNFDTVLRGWVDLVKNGVPGTLCLHLIPTTRSSLPVYRDYADTIRRIAEEANRCRPGSVAILERESRDEALWLLQHADVVVACSRADGWNLVAAEAVALGPDSQRLILSSRVGAAELLGAVGTTVSDPENDREIATRIRQAMPGQASSATISRSRLSLPTFPDWWAAISEAHHRYGTNAALHRSPLRRAQRR